MGYYVGQTVNIGYYGGFMCRQLLRRTAKIVKIDNLITIDVMLPSGGYHRMFGTEKDLQTLEKNWKE